MVYKIIKGQDKKLHHNHPLMEELGYFKKLNLESISIGKQYHLLSYEVFLGSIYPHSTKQIDAVQGMIETIHSYNMVHSDVRLCLVQEIKPF